MHSSFAASLFANLTTQQAIDEDTTAAENADFAFKINTNVYICLMTVVFHRLSLAVMFRKQLIT